MRNRALVRVPHGHGGIFAARCAQRRHHQPRGHGARRGGAPHALAVAHGAGELEGGGGYTHGGCRYSPANPYPPHLQPSILTANDAVPSSELLSPSQSARRQQLLQLPTTSTSSWAAGVDSSLSELSYDTHGTVTYPMFVATLLTWCEGGEGGGTSSGSGEAAALHVPHALTPSEASAVPAAEASASAPPAAAASAAPAAQSRPGSGSSAPRRTLSASKAVWDAVGTEGVAAAPAALPRGVHFAAEAADEATAAAPVTAATINSAVAPHGSFLARLRRASITAATRASQALKALTNTGGRSARSSREAGDSDPASARGSSGGSNTSAPPP